MGAIISLLRGGGPEEPVLDASINLEGAQPTQTEIGVYNYVSEVLRPGQGYLEHLRSYTGCGDFIRRAISSPSRETEEAAWNAVCPAVARLKDYYEFALRLEEVFPRVLQFLCDGAVMQNLEAHQATTKKLGDIMYFVSLFDELKMGNPHVQNDFSYYRRTLSRLKTTNPGLTNVVVHDELANRMSLFFAHSTPMTKALIDSALNLVSSNKLPMENVTDCFSIIAAVAYNAVSKNRVQTPEMVDYCLRVMVICIILYDHIHPAGAFVRGSKINIRSYIRVIQTNGGSSGHTLLNSIRYSTMHFNDDATPKAIKSLVTGGAP